MLPQLILRSNGRLQPILGHQVTLQKVKNLIMKMASVNKQLFWWLVELPHWFKVGFCQKILRIFILPGQLDDYMGGEI